MKIVFNGREYDGEEQMPPEIRERYLSVMQELRDAGAENVVIDSRGGFFDLIGRNGVV